MRKRLIAIGASAGGTEAIRSILMSLPRDNMPPILITQHITPDIVSAYIKGTNKYTSLDICEASNNIILESGKVYIAPGDEHLCIQNHLGKYYIQLTKDDPKNHYRPSVDTMFESVAKVMGGYNVIGIMLTGTGHDGAIGLKKLHDMGGYTIAQDKSSSLVWGMPQAAIKLKAVDEILPLSLIAYRIINLISN